MNWESYNKLTTKQKEEYNFKFNDKESFHIYSLMNITMMLFLVVAIIMFISYLIMIMPELSQYKFEVSQYIAMAGKIFFVNAIIIIGFVIEYMFRIIFRGYNYIKWKKENNIVENFWWSKWQK